MKKLFRSLMSGSDKKPKKPGKAGKPALPDGARVYAVGDIHGRDDLFAALIEAIEDDIAASDPAEVTVILLGDLVDRGPDSAGVIKRARKWQKRRNVRILFGNHEEMFVKSFTSKDTLRHFLRHGGKDTLLSYGIGKRELTQSSIAEAQALMAEAVPQKDRDFLESFEDMVAMGDYLFVHAGIDPGVPLDEQDVRSLRWIREPFLSHEESHGCMVVHGHTITDGPDETKNRIGVDTGAYASGRLTALVLEGTKRRYIVAAEKKKGGIKTEGAREAA